MEQKRLVNVYNRIMLSKCYGECVVCVILIKFVVVEDYCHDGFCFFPSATAVLVQASIEVDKTGASYYGEQTLHYLATNGETSAVQLRESADLYIVCFYSTIICMSEGMVIRYVFSCYTGHVDFACVSHIIKCSLA